MSWRKEPPRRWPCATAGQPPAGDLTRFLVVDEVRPGFAVHAALPRVDALETWQQRALLSAAGMTVVSIGFLVLTWLLVRALRQRADAEREAGGATGGVTQFARYTTQLDRTVAERTAELKDANRLLEKELVVRKAAENALREHDALLNAVTKSAAQLLAVQHEDAIQGVLELIGQTIAVSRVQFCEISTNGDGHLRSGIRQEWCAPGAAPMLDNPALKALDLTP